MAEFIADEAQLQAFSSAPAGQRQLTPALRGVIAEIATRSVLRDPWPLVRTLMAELMELVLLEFEAEGHVEVGPPQAGTAPDASKATRERLAKQLGGWEAAPPFTIQRFAELLLEPRKQYGRLDKLSLALEKLLTVVSAMAPPLHLPPRPRLSELHEVNDNPAPPEPPAASARRANGPIANGGDAAQLGPPGSASGFTGTVHAAAETAFMNSIFSSDAGPDSTPPVDDVAATPLPSPAPQASGAGPTVGPAVQPRAFPQDMETDAAPAAAAGDAAPATALAGPPEQAHPAEAAVAASTIGPPEQPLVSVAEPAPSLPDGAETMQEG